MEVLVCFACTLWAVSLKGICFTLVFDALALVFTLILSLFWGLRHSSTIEWLQWVRRTPLFRVLLWQWVAIDWATSCFSWFKYLIDGKVTTINDRIQNNIVSGAETQMKCKCDCWTDRHNNGVEFVDNFHEVGLKMSFRDFEESDLKLFLPRALPLGKILQKKLCLESFFKRNPCIATMGQHAHPLFIVGLPRTGSTWLHRLLELDPHTRTMKNWELRYPLPCSIDCGPSRLERKAFAKKTQEFVHALLPVLSKIHNVQYSDPDECIVGFMDCFFPEHCAWGCIEMPRVYEYYISKSMKQQYINYKKLIGAVLWEEEQISNKKISYDNLVFKSPHHLLKMEEIAEVFPGAVIAWLHRDPVRTVGSCCSMNKAVLDHLSHWMVDRRQIGRRTSHRLANAIKIGMDTRARMEASKDPVTFVDVHLKKLKKNTILELQKLYVSAGLTWTKEFERRITKEMHTSNSSLQGDGPKHEYSLEDFGLNAADVRDLFSQYTECFFCDST